MNMRDRLAENIFLRIEDHLERAGHPWPGERQDLYRLAQRIAADGHLPWFTHEERLLERRVLGILEQQQRRLEQHISRETASIRESIDSIRLKETVTCRFRDKESTGDFAQLIVAGGPSSKAMVRGRVEADDFLKNWLLDAVEITILDPFLFKREAPWSDAPETADQRAAAEVKYADDLLQVIGKNKNANFIYKGNPGKSDGGPTKVTQGVANRFAARLGEFGMKATFCVVDDLHDRVWMKRDHRARWHACAVGTSRGGVGKRPTYILQMSPEDCAEYLKYVEHLMGTAQKSHERPLDFKRRRARTGS
ncbi:hypothetical protein [Stenotrophomonas maltophilia]|uniref:hypothetical protein n=1 Tax=Stenotrophomonas maltophilia TaxID=40324 RepID=UPI000F676605|nr:hypothetical protein [Stenotrophomonas maltophilia]RRU77617.1 hypothetical protein EGJ89_00550 [Stenotrophomonas maltophilia]